MLLLVLASAAWAQDTATVGVVPRPLVGHPLFELRLGADVGGSEDPAPRPTICAELRPLSRLGLEACGSGAGTLNQSTAPGIMHLRARVETLRLDRQALQGVLVVGAGVAEVQRTLDEGGLRFGQAEEGAVEAAGGEGSLSAQGRWWVHERTFVVVDANVGAAWIPGAPEAVGTRTPLVPFTGLTVGMGL